MGPMLDLEAVSKAYGPTRALHEVTLRVQEGEFVVILGPSGCGKTTLLRLAAGLAEPDTGTVRIDGADQAGVPPHRRNLGFVFQEPALFPHLDVAGNVGFGLAVTGVPRPEREALVRDALALVRLPGRGGRRIDELSGGERQRVALARALAPEPPVLLLDEPLSALDRSLREDLRREVRDLHRTLGLTTLYVTHDQEEALALADRIVVLRGGRVVHQGTPRELLEDPGSAWVAGFLGAANPLPGTLLSTDPATARTALGTLGSAEAPLRNRSGASAGEAVRVLVPPNALQVVADTEGPHRVLEARPAGPVVRVALAVGDEVLEAEVAPADAPRPGDQAHVAVALGAYEVLPDDITEKPAAP